MTDRLSVIVTGLERIATPAEFLTEVRAAAGALSVDVDILPAETATLPFGAALRAAFDRATAPYIITVDTDCAGPLTFVPDLWARRHDAEIVVASRYLPESDVWMPPLRAAGSRILNAAFRRGLSLGIDDGSSALRLYRTDILRSLRLEARDYDVLQEVLVRAYAAGWRVAEIPLTYRPRPDIRGKMHGRLARAFGTAVVAGVTAAFLAAVRTSRAIPILIVAAAVDLGWWGLTYVWATRPRPVAALAQMLPAQVAGYRYDWADAWRNRPVLAGHRLAWGYAGLFPATSLPPESEAFLRLAGAVGRVRADRTVLPIAGASPRVRFASGEHGPIAIVTDRPGASCYARMRCLRSSW